MFIRSRRITNKGVSGMITADVLSELFVEEAIGVTTAEETSDPRPLR